MDSKRTLRQVVNVLLRVYVYIDNYYEIEITVLND